MSNSQDFINLKARNNKGNLGFALISEHRAFCLFVFPTVVCKMLYDNESRLKCLPFASLHFIGFKYSL